MCSDLTLSPQDIIRAYSYRFKIEIYHFYYIYKIDFYLMISLVTYYSLILFLPLMYGYVLTRFEVVFSKNEAV